VTERNIDDAQWQHLHGVALKRAHNLLRGDVEAEDVAQSAMADLFKADPWPDNPEAWLMVIVKRRCIDLSHQRDNLLRALQPEVVFNGEGEAEEALADEVLARQAIAPFLHTSYQVAIRDFLDQAMAVLTEREAELLIGAADGLSHAELAEKYGYASAGTVSQTIARARHKLTKIQKAQHDANNIF
jgi:RNA polymerase sigma factor (sigma-70 family)